MELVASADVDQVHAGLGGSAPVEFGRETGAVIGDSVLVTSAYQIRQRALDIM